MPKYIVDTNQGRFKVDLNREPSSPDELRLLLEQRLAASPIEGSSAPSWLAPDPRSLATLPPTASGTSPFSLVAEALPRNRPTGNILVDMGRGLLSIPELAGAIAYGAIGLPVETALEQAPRLSGGEAASTPLSRFLGLAATSRAFLGRARPLPYTNEGLLTAPTAQQPPVRWIMPRVGSVPTYSGPPIPLEGPPAAPLLRRPFQEPAFPVTGAQLPPEPGVPTRLDIGFQRAGEMPLREFPPTIPPIVRPGAPPGGPIQPIEPPIGPRPPLLDAFQRPVWPEPRELSRFPLPEQLEAGLARRGLGPPIVPITPQEIATQEAVAAAEAVQARQGSLPPRVGRTGPPPVPTTAPAGPLEAPPRIPLHTPEEFRALQGLPRTAFEDLQRLDADFLRNLSDEAGRLNPRLNLQLLGGGLGAAGGGYAGDTTGERIGGAAFGAMAGFALATGTANAFRLPTGAVATTPYERRMQHLGRQLDPALQAKVYAAAADAANATGLLPKVQGPALPLQVLTRALEAKDPRFAQAFDAALQQQGLTLVDAGRTLMQDPTVGPMPLIRRTASFGRFIRDEALRGNAAAQNLVKAAVAERGVMSNAEFLNTMARREIDLYRAFLVSGWRTAARNMIVQQVRIAGIETLESMTDAVWAKMFGLNHLSTIGLTPSVRFLHDYLYGAVGGEAQAVAGVGEFLGQRGVAAALRRGGPGRMADRADRLLAAAPDLREVLFQRYASDVSTRADILGPGFARGSAASRGSATMVPLTPGQARINQVHDWIEVGANTVNAINRNQEFVTRKAAFVAEFNRLARGAGLDPGKLDLVADWPRIEPLLKRSTDFALEMTFAKSPRLGEGNFMERRFAELIDLTERNAAAKFGINVFLSEPFLRFRWNSMTFLWERPFGSFFPVVRLLHDLADPALKAAITAGDVRALTKFVEGVGLYGMGLAFASSPYAGESLGMFKMPDGKQFSLGPYSPLTPYATVMQAVKHYADGTLGRHIPELMQFSREMSGRLGQTVGALDKVVEALVSPARTSDDLEFSLRGIGRFAGETGAGFLQPLTTAQNILSTYGRYLPAIERWAIEEGTQRDVSLNPWLDPMIARIPGLSQTLPERRSWLRAGPLPREEPFKVLGVPLSVEFTGALMHTPTPAESEAKRLGLKFAEIAGAGSSEPLADLLYRAVGSKDIDPHVSALVRSPWYMGLSDVEKARVFTWTLQQYREAARAIAELGAKPGSPEAKALESARVKHMFGPRMRDLLKEQGILPLP